MFVDSLVSFFLWLHLATVSTRKRFLHSLSLTQCNTVRHHVTLEVMELERKFRSQTLLICFTLMWICWKKNGQCRCSFKDWVGIAHCYGSWLKKSPSQILPICICVAWHTIVYVNMTILFIFTCSSIQTGGKMPRRADGEREKSTYERLHVSGQREPVVFIDLFQL